MAHLDVHYIELILLLLLLSVAAFGALAQRIHTPYPIILVIAGLGLSLIPSMPHLALSPDVVFFVFLPPLLFAAAFRTSWRDFRYNLVSILFLAFGLVGFTVLGVSGIAHWLMPRFDWRLGLVLGAVVSTTDAIAATSIAKRLHLPQRITDVLEGESLMNDASGLLALEFTVGLVVSNQVPTLMGGTARLLWLVVSGIGIGLVVGRLIRWVEDYLDDAPIEITLSVITPYVAYLTAEAVGSSGVLATVACGLYLGRESAAYLSSKVRIESEAVWNTLGFVLNGIVFLLIGLQLQTILAGIHSLTVFQAVSYGLFFSCVVILLRLLWVYPGALVSFLVRRQFLHQHEDTPQPRMIFVVGWTGMRGVVALAAANALPETLENGAPFPERNLILFLTFCVIFVTLVVQGLTLPSLIKRLGLNEQENKDPEEAEARKTMLQEALSELKRQRKGHPEDTTGVYQDLERVYKRRLALVKVDEEEDGYTQAQYEQYRSVTQQLRQTEKTVLIRLRDRNTIGDELFRKLQNELDLLEARAESRR